MLVPLLDKEYVYKLTFPNGMVYFGSTSSIKERWRGNGDGYRNMAVWKPIQEYGWENIKKEVIIHLKNHPTLVQKTEAALIDENKGNCYNVALNPKAKRKGKQREECKAIKHVWTINGITKTAVEWSKEYNRQSSQPISRMQRYPMMTPLEALTFPNVPRGMTARTVEFWESQGCYMGTDKSSYITDYYDWPEELKNIACYNIKNKYEKLEED